MINKQVTLAITDNGFGGEGIAKFNNYTVFVPGAIMGESVLATIVKITNNLAWATLDKVLVFSPHRTKLLSECLTYGGCELEHMEYNYQLQLKLKAVQTTLNKAVKAPFVVNPVIASPLPVKYRNKAQLHFGQDDSGQIVLGFYKNNTHIVQPITSSPLYDSWLDSVISACVSYANESGVSVYNETTNQGLLKHLIVRKLGNYMSIVVVVNADNLPEYESLILQLKNELEHINWSLYLNINLVKNSENMSNQTKLLFGQPEFNYTVMGLQVNVNPMSFFQVNDDVSNMIYQNVLNKVTKTDFVIDAYSGAGLLTALCAKKTEYAVGIEIVPPAVADANQLAKQNNITNIKHYLGDVKTQLPKVIKQYTYNNLVLILDPPRKGCEQQVLQTICEANPNKIIYISCNPSTLARDLAFIIKDNQYQIASVQPYDMFPQTSHIETVVELIKK